MLIEKSNIPIKSAYTIVLGNEELAKLITRVHATSISAGTELEKIIEDKCETLDNVDLLINNKNAPQGVFLIPKKVLQKSKLRSPQNPDFVTLKTVKTHCYIVELKVGKNFDTKKSRAEYDNLKSFLDNIANQIPYTSSIHICSFYETDKDAIYKGFKKKFEMKEILTGKEFCRLLEIDYEEIMNIHKRHQEENLRFFKEKFESIDI